MGFLSEKGEQLAVGAVFVLALMLSLTIFLGAQPAEAAHLNQPNATVAFGNNTSQLLESPWGFQNLVPGGANTTYSPSSARTYVFNVSVGNTTPGSNVSVDNTSIIFQLCGPSTSCGNFSSGSTPFPSNITKANASADDLSGGTMVNFSISFTQSQLGRAGTYNYTWYVRATGDTTANSSNVDNSLGNAVVFVISKNSTIANNTFVFVNTSTVNHNRNYPNFTYPNTTVIGLVGNSTAGFSANDGVNDTQFELWYVNTSNVTQGFRINTANATSGIQNLTANTNLGNSTYYIVYNFTGGQNYTSNATNNISIGVLKGTLALNTTLNDVPANATVSYPGATTVVAFANSTSGMTDLTFTLHAVNITTSTAILLNNTGTGDPSSAGFATGAVAYYNALPLGFGNYTFHYNTTGGGNWSSASNSTLNTTVFQGATTVIINLNNTFSGRQYDMGDIIGQNVQSNTTSGPGPSPTVTLYNNFSGTNKTVASGVGTANASNVTDTSKPTITVSLSDSTITVREKQTITCSATDIGDIAVGNYTVFANTTATLNYTGSALIEVPVKVQILSPTTSVVITKPGGGTVSASCGDTILGESTNEAGTYTVKVTAKDKALNSADKSVTFEAEKAGDGGTSGGGGSSGGGSSGGGAEVTKEENKITIITPGAAAITKFTDEELGIKEITISVQNEVKDITITVTKLEGQPASITKTVTETGKVFKYMDIKATNLAAADIDTVKIKFAVTKAWLTANNIDEGKVSLYRYTTNWDKLTTAKASEDAGNVYYNADTPGFSTFAIGGEEIAASPEQPQPEQPTQETTTTTAPSGGNILVWIALVIIVIAAVVYWKKDMLTGGKKGFSYKKK
ncbi:MAG: PGF-pre-PGF domain-containing protein [Candidatus Aenigmatarchaeota archaeon]|nr:MAG: PGF-pre-PGF domain-containing protein [Candidatus Aenigmarchaeota archaeon]